MRTPQPRRPDSNCWPALRALLVGTVMLWMGSGCAPDAQSPTEVQLDSDTILPVTVLEARRVERTTTTTIAFGKLVPTRESRLGFQRGGMVASGAAGVGAVVRSGDRLASLNQRELESQRDAVTEELNLARVGPPAPRLETRPQLEARVRQLTSQLESLEAQIAEGTIVAPYNCVVIDALVTDGERVGPNTAAYRIIEAAPPVVDVALPPEVTASNWGSEPITVRLRGQRAAAELDAAAPIVDAAGQQRTRLKLIDSVDRREWLVGETVEVEIPTDKELSGYWLPLSALHREADGVWFTLVAEPAEPQAAPAESPSTGKYFVARRVLQVMQLQDDTALVDGSLVDGELVIAAGGHRVVSGQQVTLASQESERNSLETGKTQP